jgi:4-amino-4-deoxy-L-arabinose transferase-like glycosyltransferase
LRVTTFARIAPVTKVGTAFAERHATFLFVIAAFAGVVVFVDPFRETTMEDDWAYALMVHHLLETGTYQLHDWASANPPFQILWGSLFSAIGGYSQSSLRISTIALELVGLVAFYRLALYHGLDYVSAGLATLGLLASPLILRFTFNFMTDVPFMACFIVALALYTRAFQTSRCRDAAVGSLAAAAAILTRQIGIALVLGVVVLWLSGPERRRRLPFFACALVLPALAAAWQTYAILVKPNWAARLTTFEQSQYFAHMGTVVMTAIWRPAVILQYLALFNLPFVVLALVDAGRRVLSRTAIGRGNLALFMACGFYVAGALAYGHRALDRGWLMPYLPWNFEILYTNQIARLFITAATTVGAILFAAIIWRVYRRWHVYAGLPEARKLLDVVAVALLVHPLFFFRVGDEYFIPLVPFLLIVLSRELRHSLNRFRAFYILVCVVVLVASAAWTRGLLARGAAQWAGADFAMTMNVPPEEIFADGTWNLYHGAYDRWMIEDGATNREAIMRFYTRWLNDQRRHAKVVVTESDAPPIRDRWRRIKEISYRGMIFRERHVYVLRRE